MSDTFRQVGHDLPGSSTVAAADCIRKLKIAAKPTATYEVSGDKAALTSGKPALGVVFETILGADFIVTGVDIEDTGQGNSAKMTITCESPYSSSEGSTDPIGQPQYGLKFAELHIRIEQHPCCGTLTPSSDNPKPTWDAWQDLTSSNYVPASDVPAFFSMGAWSFDTYRTKKLQGKDEVAIFYPIVTRKMYYLRDPGGIGGQSGRRQNPPTDSYDYISNYEWLAGPDELQEAGNKYERSTTWIAADAVDSDFYPAAL